MKEKKPWSVRWDNFKFALWEYYRWPIIVGVTLIAIVGGMIHSFFNRQETAFYAIAINGNMLKGEEIMEDFRQLLGAEPEDRMVFTDAIMDLQKYEETMTTMDMLFATTATKELDAVLLDGAAFASFANQALYTDLRTVLTEEELTAFGERVYYLDSADLTDVVTEEAPPVQLSNEPSSLDAPVPVAVELTGSSVIEQYSYYREGDCFYTVTDSSQRKDAAVQFLYYLMEE